MTLSNLHRLVRWCLPTLVLPKAWSGLNRWRRSLQSSAQVGRDFVLVLFSVVVMGALFHGTRTALTRILEEVHFVYLPPAAPLGLLFMMLFAMLLLSNAVAALGTLFLGRDLDLILSSPISWPRFFFGKLTDVIASSSWVTIIFGLPALVAFGVTYQANWDYYVVVAAVCVPLFLLPATLSVLAVTLFSAVVPANRTREIMLVVGALLFVALILFIRLLSPSPNLYSNINEVLRLLNLLSVPNTSWTPSYWAGQALGSILAGQPTVLPLILLYAVSGAAICIAFIAVRLLHFHAYSRSRNTHRGIRLHSKRSQRTLTLLTPFLRSPSRAILAKEVKVFARDMTQALQLVLLLGLCMLYLYNFRVLQGVRDLPEATRVWWQGFLIVSNLALGAFVVTAVCTRFVFPSVSLEGQSFWILQTAPISLRDILRTKFRVWFVPVAAMASVIFAAGALAIDAEPAIVLLTTITSCIISYGIVGLAVGLGAFFANFDWDHPSQLAACFGSLVFMLFATVLIAVNMIPAAVLIFLRTMKSFGHGFSSIEWTLTLGSTFLLLFYLNFLASRWAIHTGEAALLDRMGSTAR